MNRAAHYKYLISQMKDGDPNKAILQYQLIKEEKKLKKAKKEHLHNNTVNHFVQLSEMIQEQTDKKSGKTEQELNIILDEPSEVVEEITEDVTPIETKVKKTRTRKKKEI